MTLTQDDIIEEIKVYFERELKTMTTLEEKCIRIGLSVVGIENHPFELKYKKKECYRCGEDIDDTDEIYWLGIREDMKTKRSVPICKECYQELVNL